MANDKTGPLRMCVCCRKMIEKHKLFRLVKQKDGTILLDEKFSAFGRGAYVCPQCVPDMKKKKGFERAFRTHIPGEIYLKIEQMANKEV